MFSDLRSSIAAQDYSGLYLFVLLFLVAVLEMEVEYTNLYKSYFYLFLDIINKFLSHPIFIVLGKLNYSMYLTHVLVIMAVSGNQRQAGYFSNFRLVIFNLFKKINKITIEMFQFCDFCSNSVIIIICSTLMCLIFETPFISLLKHLDKPKDVKTQ